MRTHLFALAWAFVLGVTAYDVYFAWQYRALFETWELNPLARWAAGNCGLGAVFGFKAAVAVFAVAVAACCHLRRHWLEVPYTLFVSGVHLLLSAYYVVGQFRPI
jgi:hypothetical protein